MSNVSQIVPIDWELVRLRWEGGDSSHKIAKSLGGKPSRQGIDKKARKDGWERHQNGYAVANQLPIVKQAMALGPGHKRTPERVGLILELLGKGSTEKLACSAAGITPDTLTKWKRDDPQLAEVIRQARSCKVAEWVGHIDSAASRDWKAAERLLQAAPEAEDFSQKADGAGITVMINIDRDQGVVIDGKQE